MNSAALLLASLLLWVDYGWQPTDDGQLEYLIQIEPALVQSILSGQEIVSELPPEVRNVRRFRISVGNQALPREPVRVVSAEIPAAAVAPVENEHATKANVAGESSPANLAGGREPRKIEREGGRSIEDLDGAVQAAHVSNIDDERRGANRPAPSADTGAAPRSPSDVAVASTADGAATPAGDDIALTPWFIGALVALCASLGGNLYQGWNLASARRRYYQLVDRLGRRSGGDDGVTIVEA